jgi:hypothetical protein
MARPVTLTGSKRADLLIFGVLLGLLLLKAPHLRVYYRVTVVQVKVERVDPAGSRTPLPTPEEFQRPGKGRWRGDQVQGRLVPMIQDFMKTSEWGRTARPGTRFEWSLRWSEDSNRLDQGHLFVWEAPDAH